MDVVPSLDPDRFLSFTVIAAPLLAASSMLASIFSEYGLRRPMLRSDEPLDLARIYVGSPPAGGAHPHQVVLYEPRSNVGSTVLITNLQDGWNSLAGNLGKRLDATHARVIATSGAVEYPQVYFSVWTGGVERSVMCMRDSNAWVFHAQGAALPFEDVIAYAARKTSKRLTREMALRYVKAMGWDSVDPDFWQAQGNAVYFEQATLN